MDQQVTARYPYVDEGGDLLYEVVRLEPGEGGARKTFRQRRPDPTAKGGWDWRLNGCRRVLYHLDEILLSRSPIWLVEGEKDADGLRGLGFTATTLAGGARSGGLRDGDSEALQALAHRDVVLCPDYDEPGAAHSSELLGALVDLPADRVRLVLLHGGTQALGSHLDVSDWVGQRRGAGNSDLEIRGRLLALLAGAAELHRLRRSIVVRAEEHEVVREAVLAMARLPQIYSRSTLLVHVVREEESVRRHVLRPAGGSRILAMGQAGIRTMLSEAAMFMTPSKGSKGEEEKLVPRHPPTWLAAQVEALHSWPGVRHLDAVVDCPVLRPDGTLLEIPGYDPGTAILYQPTSRYSVADDRPSRDRAREAVRALLDVIEDFPLPAPARAAWVAGVLSPLARFAYAGPTPLFAIDANVRGAGKSLLADLIGVITCGRPMARMPQAGREEEDSKRITAIALEGDRVVLIDNIHRPLGGAALDAALTSVLWSDRVLGASSKPTLPMLAVWYATGNNITYRGDTARRVLHLRLDSPLERPEERADFRRPDILAWAQVERPRLVIEALTILRGYCLVGRPAQAIPRMGSYEGWSDLVRNAVVWAGLADPAATRAEVDAIDDDAGRLEAILDGWAELPRAGSTASDALHAVKGSERQEYPALRRVLERLGRRGEELPTPGALGCALRALRGRVSGGRRLQTRKVRGETVWFVDGSADPQPEQAEMFNERTNVDDHGARRYGT